MRILLLSVILLIPFCVHAQFEGDTVVVKNGGNAIDEANYFGDKKFVVRKGDTLSVLGRKDDYLQVKKKDLKGWINRRDVYTADELEELRQKRAAKKRRKKKRRKLLEKLRSKGYTVLLGAQSFERNSAGGIEVGLSLVNISDEKTLKYATATWQLYNPVGDPVQKDIGSSTAQTRFVGPLKPGEAGQTTFEDVWHSNVGSCAELKKLVVEHIDGSSFTYVNDLKDIAQLSETIRLDDDCSYQAQQSRK